MADLPASPSANDAERAWVLEQRRNLYEGFYRIDRLRFRHTLHRGDWSDTIDRELFVRGNVVAVLPYDPETDEVVLVEQFRIGAMERHDGPWLMEVIAGMIDTDETPEQVAIREAREEAGLELQELQEITRYLASPGSTTEEVFLYYTETDLSEAGGLFGLDQEDEDIRLHRMGADDALAMLDAGRVCNALSIIALQWLRIQRSAGTGTQGRPQASR